MLFSIIDIRFITFYLVIFLSNFISRIGRYIVLFLLQINSHLRNFCGTTSLGRNLWRRSSLICVRVHYFGRKNCFYKKQIFATEKDEILQYLLYSLIVKFTFMDRTRLCGINSINQAQCFHDSHHLFLLFICLHLSLGYNYNAFVR